MDDRTPSPSLSDDSDELDGFQRLVREIRSILGSSAGINDVDPQRLQDAMDDYRSSPADWEAYALADRSRAYTRNLVDKGNGHANLLILVWTAGKASPIHDHANAHCIMKVLQGTLKESLYSWPDESTPPLLQKETLFTTDGTTYMSDKLGLHRISNASDEDLAVSLHLYTPPNAEHFGCQIFDAKTGKASKVKQCNFYSYRGTRIVGN